MPFKKVKDDNNNNDIIEEGLHNLFYVPNGKIKNIRIINKVDNFYIVMMHKKYINDNIILKICDKDEIINKDNCNNCKHNKPIKTYITLILPLNFYFKPEQIKTRLWILPPYKFTDVFEKFNIIQLKHNKDYDIKNYVFTIKRENNKFNLSYVYKELNHKFINVDEEYWINYLKSNYYNDIKF